MIHMEKQPTTKIFTLEEFKKWGRIGGKKTAQKYPLEIRRKYWKKGGRPKKALDNKN